jgi:hypothetical protein
MGYLLDTDLDKARESLAHIQRASEAALEERHRPERGLQRDRRGPPAARGGRTA